MPAVLATGCGSDQSVTSPVTEPAREIDTLWWAMFAAGMVIFAVVLGLLAAAFVRRRRSDEGERAERASYAVILGGGMVAPVVLLAVLFAFVIRVMPAVSAPSPGSTRLTVEVIGHDWYWEVRYPGTDAVTANEIHLPTGTPVRVVARTGRRHPQLLGAAAQPQDRHDPRPLEQRRAGRAEGRHLPRPVLRVLRPGATPRWPVRGDRRSRRMRSRPGSSIEAQPAETPPAGPALAGERDFVNASCADCHAIRGTTAAGRVGPDLTHIGSRRTLAALTIPNTPGDLMQWISNPQRFKPGSRMPGFASLPASVRRALVAYLESLR